ncbi:hypothetical protein Brsp02_04094 [Brucella sp. NBRC 113783]
MKIGIEQEDLQLASACVTRRGEVSPVTKVLPVLLVLLMGMHIIKPLGLPGLKRRGDFWKIAVIAIFVMALAVGFHFHES